MDRVILHSDINCCYASIEMLYRPELKGRPLAVGGREEDRHGIILTANYEAKKFGVKVGMPLWQARNICPFITIVEPRMDLYLKYSKMAHELYSEYTDYQEPFGIDESWLDISTYCNNLKEGEMIAYDISRRFKKEIGITISIGVSWNKVFAKLGSDYKKPDGITVITRDNYKNIVWPLKASDLLYVGRSTRKKLDSFGINTIGELAKAPKDFIKSKLGKNGLVLHEYANGLDASLVRRYENVVPLKSIGNSVTAVRDLKCDRDVRLILYMLAENVSRRLRNCRFKSQGIEIYIRDNTLYSFSRQKKLKAPINTSIEIVEEAFNLFKDSYDFSKPIRSIGVRAIDLVNDSKFEQLNLFSDYEQKDKELKLEKTVDKLRSRFGFSSVQRGIIYEDKKLSQIAK